MYTNFLPFEGRSPLIIPDWFIQVLIQSLLIIGFMFSFKKVREKFSENLWSTSFIVLILFIVLRVKFDDFYDTHYLFQRVPPIYLASIWLGWVIYTSESINQKIITFIAAFILSFIHLGISTWSLWISAGSFCLLFIDSFKLIRILKILLTTIASATFYLYLFHTAFIHIPANFLKLNSSLINFLFGVLGSISVWYIFESPETKRVFAKVLTYLQSKKAIIMKIKPK